MIGRPEDDEIPEGFEGGDADGIDEMVSCGLGEDGKCAKAGSEECEQCPMRDSELFVGSDAWKKRLEGDKP